MEKIILTIPAYDPEGRRIPDGAVHFWNGTTPDSVENEKLKKQVKSFEQYRAEVAVKKIADKMLVDNLIMQLAEAKAVSIVNDLKEIITELRTDLEPIKKALKFKIHAESTQNWQNELANKMRIQMVLKGGTGK